MTTVALQMTKADQASGQQASLIGPVTGTVYTVDALGRAVVSTLDSPTLLTRGWCYANLVDAPGYATSGVATINFGAFPGSPSAQAIVALSGPANPNAVVQAWIEPIATADHSADEHSADPPAVSAQIVGSTIVINAAASGRDWPTPPATPFGNLANSQQPIGLQQPQPYGAWSVGWALAA
jgi:hypothetical protein